MAFIGNIILFALGAFVLHYWWQSGEFKARAMAYVLRHCKQFDLQLLDDSLVIKGYWPYRDDAGDWFIRRRYQFEFTSTGHQRYSGSVELKDYQMQSIEIEAYQLPNAD